MTTDRARLTELLRCPFCGERAFRNQGATLAFCDDRKCAIYGIAMTNEQWNRRSDLRRESAAPDSGLSGEIAELIEEIPAIRSYYKGCTFTTATKDINRLCDAVMALRSLERPSCRVVPEELSASAEKDARRYRTLKGMSAGQLERLFWQAESDDELDSAIDAASGEAG